MKTILAIVALISLTACAFEPLDLDGCPFNERPCMEKGGEGDGGSGSAE
jgi:hypothetical protein